ncbi:MAG: tocopherol cyclase family protein [Firmicutes bacterium]|nr:tocopherol cyclase family protein [Bacillota bacterium]
MNSGFSKSDITRNECMLTGRFGGKGYDWWWHSFTGRNRNTGEEKAFFIEFFLCNPDRGEREPVLGQLPENKRTGRKPSYLMVKAGSWGEDGAQLHRFFGWEELTLKGKAPFALAAEDCYLSETATRGRVSVSRAEAEAHPEYMCQAGKMSWKLKIEKMIPFNVGYGAGKLFRELKAFEMYWHAEGMKTAYSGVVAWNGEIYDVRPENCWGYADKNWGSDFTTPWVWLSSNHMVSRLTGKKLENSVFDIGGGKPRVFGIPLDRKLLGAFYYEGKEYEFNFSKFWTFPRTRFRCVETDDSILWQVKQESSRAVMLTEVRCKKKDMLLVNYEAPDGSKRHNRLWNGGTGTGRIRLYKKEGIYHTLIDDINVSNVGCEYGEFD